jgi:hypothetical protein
MKKIILAAVVACTPVAAAALSCMPHSVQAAFQQAQESEAKFLVVRGRLEFDARKLPKTNRKDQRATPEQTRIAARLKGTSLSAKGFSTPYNQDVTLSVACFGPWCASAQRGTEVLAFVELGAQGNVISINPCGGYLFGTPTPKMIRAVKTCFAGGACTSIR